MSSVWSIRRSIADKKLAGVCGGVARHWNVDPILVRVGWMLLALSGGVGIVLYVAAWLLVPADGSTTSTMDDLTKGQTSSWPREAWVAIVAVACLVTFVAFSSTTSVSFWPAVVLALIWYFGYYKSKTRQNLAPTRQPPPEYGQPPQYGQPPEYGQPLAYGEQGSLVPPPAAGPFRYPGPATAFTEAAEAWRERVEDMRRGATGPSATAPGQMSATPQSGSPQSGSPQSGSAQSGWQAAPATPTWQGYPYDSDPSAVQDPTSPDVVEAVARADFLATPDPAGLYTEAAPLKAAAAPSRRTQAKSLSARRLRLMSLVVLGLVLLGLGIADSLGASITPVIYAASALLVVGLTLIAATWLGRARGILPIGLLLLLVVLGMSVAKPASEFVHEFSYTSTSQLAATPVTVDHGLVRVKLQDVALTSDATFTADVGTGAIEIEVPQNTNVVLDYSVGNGVVMDNDTTIASGQNQHGTAQLRQSRDSQHTLTLDVDVDRGMVAVKR